MILKWIANAWANEAAGMIVRSDKRLLTGEPVANDRFSAQELSMLDVVGLYEEVDDVE